MNSLEDIVHNNAFSVVSLGGCIVHDVCKYMKDAGVEVNHHLWRRPTIALMSNPVTRSRFKLNDLPAPFVNYFVNDVSKLHRSEIESLENKDVIVLDITRDLFTGVIEIEPESYIMDVLEAVGIVDGLSSDVVDEGKLKSIIGRDIKAYRYHQNGEEFFELWCAHFLRLLEFLGKNFKKIILLKLFFTDRLVGGHVNAQFSETAQRGNAMLERMYEFAQDQGVCMVGLEREAYVTGHFVDWGGPSLTHYVRETTLRLADRVLKALSPDLGLEDAIKSQAYVRAGAYEETMIWLNQEKGRMAELLARLDAEAKQRKSEREAVYREMQTLTSQVEMMNKKITDAFLTGS